MVFRAQNGPLGILDKGIPGPPGGLGGDLHLNSLAANPADRIVRAGDKNLGQLRVGPFPRYALELAPEVIHGIGLNPLHIDRGIVVERRQQWMQILHFVIGEAVYASTIMGVASA